MSTDSYRSPGVGADDKGGTIGVCYPYGSSSTMDAPDLRFAIIDPMGRLLGEPVSIAAELRYIAACAVAASGIDEYAVVWWNATREAPRHSILAATVYVRR